MTRVYLCSEDETAELGTARVDFDSYTDEVILRDVSFTADRVAAEQVAALQGDVKFYQDALDRERGWVAEYKKHRDEMADTLAAKCDQLAALWERCDELEERDAGGHPQGDDHFSESWRRINQDRINLSAANSALREENKRLATELNMIADIINQAADRSDAREDPF